MYSMEKDRHNHFADDFTVEPVNVFRVGMV